MPPAARDDALAFAAVWARQAAALAEGRPALREAVAADPAFVSFCRSLVAAGLPADEAAARAWLESNFEPHHIVTGSPGGMGLLTGYYEPEVPGTLQPVSSASTALRARPADLGAVLPYPTRREIEARPATPGEALVYVADRAEAFLIQVQGSARVVLPDGRRLRLTYAGRNGRPYTSIGRILIESGAIAERDMSLATLKQWLRQAGLNEGEAGAALLHRNESFVFFAIDDSLPDEAGPIGGAGLPLEPLLSIAVDRTLFSYGLPFIIEADLPWRTPAPEAFGKLMLAQDTGSAIVGPARADIFFGTGASAGVRAGDIRHPARFSVLLPKGLA
ncbi:MAG: MltA domain-containing protein [Hyphomicrobiales bacterium]|nr:MltA domain-containing protein [Hyphomicrobiales bacterium]